MTFKAFKTAEAQSRGEQRYAEMRQSLVPGLVN